MIISVQNLLPVTSPITYLSAPIAVGVGTLPVKALNQFNASWAVQVGATGEAQTEILLLGTAIPSGTIGTTTGTTIYAHPSDAPVYGIKYDQIVFERSTLGTAGTATPIAGGTVAIQANGTATIFDDTSGSATYAYKTYFRSSGLNLTSSESAWITFAGYSPYMLASIRQRIKDKLYNANFISNDAMINAWINEWLEQMQNAAIEVNKDYSLGSTSIGFSGTADLGTITASDFKQARRIWMNQGGTASYEASVVDINGFDPNTVYDQTLPIVYFFGDNVLGRNPHASSGTANMIYYKTNPVLVEDTDTLPVVMQSYSKSFVDYGLAQALRKDNKNGDSLEASAQAQLTRFRMDITPRAQTGPIYARIDEDISSDSDNWY